MSGATLDRDIQAFEKVLPELLLHHKFKYVVFHEGQFVGSFDSFQNAASFAVGQFGLGPYLIRQVKEKQDVQPMPASVAYRPVYAAG